MKPIATILLAAVLLASFEGQSVNADWLSDLLSGVNAQVANINKDISERMARVNENVRHQVAQAQKNAEEAIKNAEPLDSLCVGDMPPGNPPAQSNIVIRSHGFFQSVQSGTDHNGKPYWHERVERITNGVLYRIDRVYDFEAKKYVTYVYERKLTDAEPIFNNFTEPAHHQPPTDLL